MAKGRSKKKQQVSGVDAVLAPIAALLVLGGAFGSSMLERAKGGPPKPAPVPPAGGGAPDGTREPAKKGIKAKLDKLGQRFKPLGRALDVQQRYSEVRGNNLAASVTFQAFVSLLPLLLVIVAAIGFVSAGAGPDVAGRIIGGLGLDGDAARAVTDAVKAAENSRRTASVVGLAGLLWSGLGLVNGLQFAMNQVWQVEERGIKDKAVGLGWLLGAALIFVASAAITTALRWLPGAAAPLGIIVTFGVSFVLWLWTSRALPNIKVPWKRLIPGAVLGAIGLEVLKVVGAFYVPKAVESSSQLYGSLGIVFAILAWLLFFGRLIVYSTVLNVVMYERRSGTVMATVAVPALPGAEQSATRAGRIDDPDIG